MNRSLVIPGAVAALVAAALFFWLLVSHDGSGKLASARPPSAANATAVGSGEPRRASVSTAAPAAASAGSNAVAGAAQVTAAIPAPARKPSLDDLPAELRARVRHFEDAGVPVAKRLEELAALARQGDAAATAILMALGDEYTYLNYAAVQALGCVKAEGVAPYLAGKLADPDPRVLSAAAKSLVQQKGDAAVAELAATIKANHQRPDGFQDTVCAACAEALGETRSAKAVPVLDAELKEMVGVTLPLAYGSQVVNALVATGRTEAQPVLLAYAERLSRELPKYDDNPMGKRFVESKIAEARQAAEGLGKP